MKDSKCPYLIVYEDEEALVAYKKRDVLSVATDDKKTYTHNLFYYLRSYSKKKNESLYLVHRLDFETSGLIIFAKTKEVESKLKEAFLRQEVVRDYEAVVKEELPLDYRKHLVMSIEEEGKKEVISSSPTAKKAITDIEAINHIQIGTALHVSISTGRHNQIRLALTSLGLSLLGDTRYSNTPSKRMYLNEYHLSFPTLTMLHQSDFSVEPLWIKKL